jgi:hypothetical protein
MTPAIADHPMAAYHFYQLGLQYYAAARFASLGGLLPVSGNLFHHAVEMTLKGKLTHSLSLKQLQKTLGHDLKKIWHKFKALFPNDDLSSFDQLIDRLDDFEKLRYPDNLLANGAQIMVGFGEVGQVWSGQPTYSLSVTEVDALMAQLFVLCPVNPGAYMGRGDHHAAVVEVIERGNASCAGWFSERADNAVASS